MAKDKPKINIKPISRVATPGVESRFEVTVEGAEEMTIDIRPCEAATGYEVTVDEQGGGKKILTIKTPQAAGMARMDFYVEARDASGKAVAKEHAQIVMAAKVMPSVFFVSTIVGFVLVAIGLTANATWARISLYTLGGTVVLVAILSSIFGIWGKHIGFPWHFTRDKQTAREG